MPFERMATRPRPPDTMMLLHGKPDTTTKRRRFPFQRASTPLGVPRKSQSTLCAHQAFLNRAGPLQRSSRASPQPMALSLRTKWGRKSRRVCSSPSKLTRCPGLVEGAREAQGEASHTGGTWRCGMGTGKQGDTSGIPSDGRLGFWVVWALHYSV